MKLNDRDRLDLINSALNGLLASGAANQTDVAKRAILLAEQVETHLEAVEAEKEAAAEKAEMAALVAERLAAKGK